MMAPSVSAAALKNRILFVDDEPQLLKMLQVALRRMPDWDASFAESGETALALMEQNPFDVIISDMRMPGMNGAQLLNEVMKRYPHTLRIILSGFADQEMIMKCVGSTHQYLYKPCSLETLRAVLERLRKINGRLACPELKALAGRISSMPSVPSLYFSIMEALQDPNCSTDKVGQIIASDPAMTTKMLQLVNSAFFGFARNVSNPTEAVQLLGMGRIRSLALSILIFSAFDSRKLKHFSVDAVWKHSVNTAMGAQEIVSMETEEETLVEQAFSAGLLHDLGKLILADNLPGEYDRVLEQAAGKKKSLVEAEQKTFGATHAELGAYLLEMWGLPVPLVESVAWHHTPEQGIDQGFGPLTAVHVADAFYANEIGVRSSCSISREYLKGVGKADRLDAWQKALQKWK